MRTRGWWAGLGLTVAVLTGTVLSPGAAHADIPPGYWQELEASLPSARSDVEFPSSPILLAPVAEDPRSGAVEVDPYLAPWLHALIPVEPTAAVELQGGVDLTTPGGVVHVRGHCVFAGAETAYRPTHVESNPQVRLGDASNGVHIDATVAGG
ncbi:hypothetical protein [Rhodococcus sp. IEGM1428]|uniref:hypothetical protein n=1 Tax=Rhodococcus sp. IEGM1428 TaxID=3392191 RepID=UPI003D10BEA2